MFAPVERLLMENSRIICWDFDSTDRSAGIMVLACNVLITSTLSRPWPSSPGPVLENSSRRLSNVFEHRTNAL